MFLLSADRADASRDCLAEYRAYLAENAHRFPRGAYRLAKAPWYTEPLHFRCPHGARLGSWTYASDGDGTPGGLRILLHSADLRGRIIFLYKDVYARRMHIFDGRGVRDTRWRFDELRVTDDGHVLHEIEWNEPAGVGTLLIEAADVEFHYTPGDFSGDVKFIPPRPPRDDNLHIDLPPSWPDPDEE